MLRSFPDAVRTVSRRFVAAPVVEQALSQLGPRFERARLDDDIDRLAALINQFVRSVPGLSVREAASLERELAFALDALPRGTKTISPDSAIALIALRNHVRYLTVCAGLEWSEAMLLQSAVSELARVAREAGGGLFHLELDDGRIVIQAELEHRSVATFELSSFRATMRSSQAEVRISESDQRATVDIEFDPSRAAVPDRRWGNA